MTTHQQSDAFWSGLAPRDPSVEYDEAHKWLKALNPDDSVHWIFGSMRNLQAPLVDRKAKEPLLGVYSFDPRLLNFQRLLSSTFNHNFEPSLDDNKFVGANGVHRTFDSLRTVSGYCSTPMSYMTVNNALYCQSLGLKSGFKSERHKAIFDEMFSLVFGRFKYRPLRVPKLSTAGFPTGTSDPVWKRRTGLWLLNNMEEPLDMVAKGRYWDLAKKYGIIFCYKQQKRTQVDNPGKKRKAFDLRYALSGGSEGKEVDVDKSVQLEGVKYDDFNAVRVRAIHGAPFLTNIPLQAISTGTLYAMFEWAAPTFHHTNMDKIAEQIELSGNAVFSDISNYDNSMAEFILDAVADAAGKYWDDRLVQWCKSLFYAPYFTQPVDYVMEEGKVKAKGRPQMIGDPRKGGKQVVAGNRSGHAWTSLVAKTVKVWDTLCIIDDLVGDVLGNVEAYLQHKMPLKIVNNGDDEGLIGPPDLIEAYRVYRFNENDNPGYFKAEPEVGQVFSGFMFMKVEGKVRAIPRLHTPFEKIYVPERSIGGNFRPYWAIGIEQRLTLDLSPGADFVQNPSLGKALDIHHQLWRDHMARHFGPLTSIILKGKSMEPTPLATGALSRIDIEVLEKPEKLVYKYTDADVSPQVLKIIAGSNIMPEEYEGFIDRYYQGVILDDESN